MRLMVPEPQLVGRLERVLGTAVDAADRTYVVIQALSAATLSIIIAS